MKLALGKVSFYGRDGAFDLYPLTWWNPWICPQSRLESCFRDTYITASLLLTSVLCSQCISGYNIYFLSFCHHSGFLTCTDLPVVDLAHPVVALAERTVVFAGLCHLADADSTFASASVTAHLPPWDAAPELRLGPGQPARSTTQTAPAEDSKQNKLQSKPGAAAQSWGELGSWETTLRPRLQPIPGISFLMPSL